ncbi:docking protein 2 [Clinocottus analis]|uniref:docking protein 2 n=1 Tax=Clinocottus analis TaxID=304258 RepID=UPI0035C0B412
MEEDIRKQGALYLQQQRFGKKWKRIWCVLFKESSCSISRLEFFDCKDGGSEKSRKQQENKKVIRLSDCIRVSEVEMDGCPRDTEPFLMETTEKIYVFSVERLQREDWTHKLCETAFPMNWTDPEGRRSSLLRGRGVDKEAGMEDNSLYSGRETVRDFRVCVRRTEASDRCRLRGDVFLRAEADALLLLRRNSTLFTWPYRYLRRFGRDKTTFSFEAGRRCDSGEGGFEFDTKEGNFLFQAVEAAINLQRAPQSRACSRAGPEPQQDRPQVQSEAAPLPQPRGHVPQSPAAPEADGVYSMVTETQAKDKEGSTPSHQQQQQRLQLPRLEPPVDKLLTGVKSLTLDPRGGGPRKNQVKSISSCPLPRAESLESPESHGAAHDPDPDRTYSRVALPAAGTKRGGGAAPPEPEYSLPFDTIATTFMSDILDSHQALGGLGADPLYDSIDEMKIRNVFLSDGGQKAEHIYDEPEGCAAPKTPKGHEAPKALEALEALEAPGSVYDDPEEVRGDAWRLMGAPADPKGHEYPYNARVDDYAVPKRAQRALPVPQSTNEEEKDVEDEPREEDQEKQRDSPYSNVRMKMV